jgi:hypothetical protein
MTASNLPANVTPADIDDSVECLCDRCWQRPAERTLNAFLTQPKRYVCRRCYEIVREDRRCMLAERYRQEAQASGFFDFAADLARGLAGRYAER